MKMLGRYLFVRYVLFLNGLVTASGFNISSYCNTVRICTVTNVTFGDESVLRGEENKFVVELTFEDSILKNLPNVFHYLPNLEQFTAENCGLSQMHSENFREAKALKVLDLILNNIQDLSSNVFRHMPNLEDVRLGHNYISAMYADTFANASQITDLQLNANKIQSLPETIFWPLTALEYIDLEFNQIEIIDSGLFKNNPKLKTVLLNNNNLLLFEENSLTYVPFLYMVDISFNNIHSISLNSVNTLRATKAGLKECNINGTAVILSLSLNHMTELNVNNLSIAREINIRGNKFQNLKDFVDIRNLFKLDVSFNPIVNMRVFNFEHYKNLNELRLSGTNLTLHYGGFSHLTSLTALDISNNNLKFIDFGILKPLQKLEKLYIDGNGLTSIKYTDLKLYHPSLNELGILNNPWNCSFLEQVVMYCQSNDIKLRVPARLDKTALRYIAGIMCTDPISTLPIRPVDMERPNCILSSTDTYVFLSFLLILFLVLLKAHKLYVFLRDLYCTRRNQFMNIPEEPIEL